MFLKKYINDIIKICYIEKNEQQFLIIYIISNSNLKKNIFVKKKPKSRKLKIKNLFAKIVIFILLILLILSNFQILYKLITRSKYIQKNNEISNFNFFNFN